MNNGSDFTNVETPLIIMLKNALLTQHWKDRFAIEPGSLAHRNQFGYRWFELIDKKT